jgi:uncharacterized protein YkwD
MSTAFNLIDLLLAVIVLLGVLNGWRKGFVWGVLDLLVLAASLLAAFVCYGWLAGQLERYTSLSATWSLPVAFLAVWAVVQLILGTLASALAAALPAAGHAHVINRLAGLAPGLVQGAVNAVLVALILLALPGPPGLIAAARESVASSYLARPAQRLVDLLAPVFQGAVTQTLAPTPASPNARHSVKLGYTVANAPAQPALEQQMLELVNQERAREGLAPLRADPELTEVARAHSRDMLARGYFSHGSPEGKDAFGRMRDAGVAYLAAGENLAHAPTLAQAHQGLMKSPGHRANILRPAFGRVGIGIVDAGRHGLMATQNFRN